MKVDIDNKDVGLINSVIKKLPYQQTLKQFVSSSIQHYIDYLKKKRVIWKSLTSLTYKSVFLTEMYRDELVDEDVLDVFYLGFGQLRKSIKETVPDLWMELVELDVEYLNRRPWRSTSLVWTGFLGDRRNGKINPIRSVWCSRLFEHSFEHPLQPQSPRDVCQPQTSTKSSGGLTLGLFEPCLNGRMVLLVKQFSVFVLNTCLN